MNVILFLKINWRKYYPLTLMLIFPVLSVLYKWTNRPSQDVYTLVTPFDTATPFIKYFALPYGVWIFYIYACLVYFFMKDLDVYYKGLATYTVCILICYAIYTVFQTTVLRPELTGNDPFTWLMKFIYNRDNPYNCFPSIHCFSSYMVMRLVWSSSFRNKWNVSLITAFSLLIIMSTLFIKQHVVMDVFAGILLVEFVLAAKLLIEAQVKKNRHNQEQKRTYGT